MAIFRRNKRSVVDGRLDSDVVRSKFVRTSNLQQSITKTRKPLDSLRNKGIVTESEDESHLIEVRKICRDYYKYHDLIPIIITIYARFPIQGMRIVCQTDEQQDLFEEQFFEKLNYRDFLTEVGQEFFTVGEANVFGIFDPVTKEWVSEEILNPDDITIEESVFVGQDSVLLTLPTAMQDAVRNPGSPDHEYLEEVYPDVVDAVRDGAALRLDNKLVFRMVEKATPWDTRGTPMMTRVFSSLLAEESLNAAQDAIADRLYSPLVLARLGIPANEMGKDQQPWIPTQEQLNSFANTFDEALAADFRAIVHHFGIDIRNVFGRESMPRFDNDFDRVERKIMRAFGIGPALIDGSNAGAYASSAINRDFITQLMTTYQRNVQRLFESRARVLSESRGIYETYTNADGEVVNKTRTTWSKDEFGHYVAHEVPVPFVPKLEFATSPLRDSAFELNLLNQLRSAGVPISDAALIDASGQEIDLDVELSRIESEELKKTLARVGATNRIEEELRKEDVSMEEAMPPQDQGEFEEPLEQETSTYQPSKETEVEG